MILSHPIFLYRNTIVFIFLLLFTGCASIVTPGGGPRDTTPPALLKATPAQYTTNFNTKEIELEFNEFIDLKDLNNQLLISPPMNKSPEIRVNKKKLLIQLRDSLSDHTTYNMNFGNSIRDFTEGNAVENLSYVFSTGKSIDSLEIRGRVTRAEDLKPDEKIIVALYKDLSDSFPLKKKPYYVGKADKNGRFKIKNLPKTPFKVLAIKDESNDYIYQPGAEMAGFADSLIMPGSKDSVILRIFKEKRVLKQKIKKANTVGYGKIQLIFNNPLQKPHLDLKESELRGALKTQLLTNRDTMWIWYSPLDTDTLTFYVRDGLYSDTVKVKILNKDFLKKKNIRGNSKFLGLSTNLKPELGIYEDIFMETERPVLEYDLDRIKLWEDSTEIHDFYTVVNDSMDRRFSLAYPWKEKSKYRILIPEGTFSDALGMKNDTVKSAFSIKPTDSYGSLSMKIILRDSVMHYLIQLYNDKGDKVKEDRVTGSTVLSYNFLNPEKYTLKAIADKNRNGKWDTGNYLGKVQPENVYFYKEKIDIRAGWQVEEEWVLIGN